jgi:hypothetical protein
MPDESSPRPRTVLGLFKIQLNVVLSFVPNVGFLCVSFADQNCTRVTCCAVFAILMTSCEKWQLQVLTHSAAAVISHAQTYQPQYLYTVWKRNVSRTLLTLKMEALQLFETPGPQPAHSISDRTWTDESRFDFQQGKKFPSPKRSDRLWSDPTT